MKLPNVEKIKSIAQRIALLDSIIEQEWEYRYYSYNCNWSDSEEMGSMRDGSGNMFFILFKDDKCFIKVIDKEINKKEEILLRVNKIVEEERIEIIDFLEEPAFYVDDISSLHWNINDNWTSIEFEKSNWLNIFFDPIKEYQKFAEDYYEKKISVESIAKILYESIDLETIKELNPEVNLDLLNEDTKEIGIKVL